MAPRRPAAPRARARRALRLQPDHRPPRPRRPGPRAPPRADARPGHVRHPPTDRPRPRGLDVVHRGGPAPGPRPGDPRRHRADRRRRRRRRRGPGDRDRRLRGPPRAAPDGRRRAAAARAGLPVRGPVSRACSPATSRAGSLYELLGARYDTRVARARESLEPIALPQREAQLLGVEPHKPALRIEGLAYDPSGRPVEFARSFVRGDRTRYYVERVVVRSSPRSDDIDAGAVGAATAAVRRQP